MAIVGTIPPPPGVTPNFVNPEHRGKNVVVLILIGFPISFMFLVMRLYTKARINRSFGSEDVCIFFAWVFATSSNIILLIAIMHKGEGLHLWNVPLDRFIDEQKYIFSLTVLHIPAIALAKISLLLIFTHLTPSKIYRLVIWGLIAMVAVHNIILMALLIFACHPIAKSWDIRITSGSCIERPAVYLATAAMNVATDAIILATPIPMLLSLKLPLQQKIGLGLLFAVGSLTLITSIVRITTIHPIFTSPDQTWVTVIPALWVVVDSNLTIVCACIMSLKSFLRHHAPRLIGEKPTYPGNSYFNTPRSKGLVINKDVSFNLTWQDEAANRSHPSDGYIEMDDVKQGPSNRSPHSSESQEVIILPTEHVSTSGK